MKRRFGRAKAHARGESPLEGAAVRFGRQGDSWVETERGAFAVAGAVPGDRVRVVPEASGKPRRARLVELLDPSADRVEPECALATRCGGCPMMLASAELERSTKIARIMAALGDAPKLPGLELEWHPAPAALGYRRRVRLAFEGGRAPRLGFRERRSERLLDVAACPVLERPLEDCLPALRERLLPSLRGGGELRLALGEGRRPVASIHAQAMQPPPAYAAAEALVASGAFAGVALFAGDAGAPAIFGAPHEQVVAEDGLPMLAALAGFSQANDAVNRELVREAVELAAPEGASVLELFAGAGNLTVPLARRAARVVAVELAADAVAAARENLRARGLVAKVVVARAEETPRGRYDVVVLDPPRQGAGEATTARIVEARPRRIVYVSCEPSTLARDLRGMASAGYRVDRVHAFDMFPRTAHVEVLVRLVAP